MSRGRPRKTRGSAICRIINWLTDSLKTLVVIVKNGEASPFDRVRLISPKPWLASSIDILLYHSTVEIKESALQPFSQVLFYGAL